EAGQDCSMNVSASALLAPVIQSVMPRQNDEGPTAAGMRSEPSNRKVVDSFCRICADSRSIGLERLAGSRPGLALIQPLCPISVPAFAFALAHSGDYRYAWNAWTSGRSENASTNSEPTRIVCGAAESMDG